MVPNFCDKILMVPNLSLNFGGPKYLATNFDGPNFFQSNFGGHNVNEDYVFISIPRKKSRKYPICMLSNKV